MTKDPYRAPGIASPASTGNAGPQFEAKVGAFYVLALLAGGEPRGLPGAVTRSVAFQQRVKDRPLDDIVIEAVNADGSAATLEIQAKRTLTFTKSDTEFQQVVGQLWEAAQNPDFATKRYELAVATARTTTRIELVCHDVLHWARQLPNGSDFAAHIARQGFASNDMRDFVAVFRDNLAWVGAPTDKDTVWRLLRRFQILVFDFESVGSDYEFRARERAGLILSPEQTGRARDLWSALIDRVGACARAAGTLERPSLVAVLREDHGLVFGARPDVRPVYARLSEAADRTLDDISETVGDARLARHALVDQANTALENHRLVVIEGAPGVGKSSLLKHLATRLQREGHVVVMRNDRLIAGGWLQMAHTLGWVGSQAELFNELGCGGGAVLFIDNIDQIDDPAAWATIIDLLSEVGRSPGWRAVVTSGPSTDDWKMRLPGSIRAAGVAGVQVTALGDEEKAALSAQNKALAHILGKGHPARGVAENLFYLSRMIDLGVGDDGSIATELDLAQLWWRYAGGRSEDDRRFARLKLLRGMGTEIITDPRRATFDVDHYDATTVAELLRLDSLREDIRGATISFRHDVLRDWTIGFQLHERTDAYSAVDISKSLPVALARGLEVAARLALAHDTTGQRWLELLAFVERDGSHGTWKRPVLLALLRAENAVTLLIALEPVLFEAKGRRLRDIIRLMLAIESEPLANVIAQVSPGTPVPAGASDLVVPKGNNWMSLVAWLALKADALPRAVIPEAVKVFQAWLIATQHYLFQLNEKLVGLLFDWLTLLRRHNSRAVYRQKDELPPRLDIDNVRDVRREIRMTVFTFARLHAAAAAQYLSDLTQEPIDHDESEAIIRFPGSLADAAPKPLADFLLAALIPKEEVDNSFGQRRAYRPFGYSERLFLHAAADQGPFLGLLNRNSAEGLRVIRGLVEYATSWWIEQYSESATAFPSIVVHFPAHDRTFRGDLSIYLWSRNAAPSSVTTTALMALEAWGHQQLDKGRAFADVMIDVFGPDGASIAFVAVAIDLALSHWPRADDDAWPMIANPQLLQLDHDRYKEDLLNANLSKTARRPGAPSSQIDLRARPSRRWRLIDRIGYYVFNGHPEPLAKLKEALRLSGRELNAMPERRERSSDGLHALHQQAVQMTDPTHWERVKAQLADGSEVEGFEFRPDLDNQRLRDEHAERAAADMDDLNHRSLIERALFDTTVSTAEVVSQAVRWAMDNAGSVAIAGAQDTDDFNLEWTRRAVLMAAALAVRDYRGSDEDEILRWARSVLKAALSRPDRDYSGNDQIQYNSVAIAVLGYVYLFVRLKDVEARGVILERVADQHPAVFEAIGRNFQEIHLISERMPRSLTRIVMVGSVRPYRVYNERQELKYEEAYRKGVDVAIAAEHAFLDGEGLEPTWPALPPWGAAIRRRIWEAEEAGEYDDEDPSHYIDEHVLGSLADHLTRLTISATPAWLVSLSRKLVQWTVDADHPSDDEDHRRFNSWPDHFFHFLGFSSVSLSSAEVISSYVTPIVTLRDDAFHDAMAPFLRGFDLATCATDTQRPDDPVALRQMFASRIKQSRNYRRLMREKGLTSETHAGDGLNAMFFQPPRFFNRGRPTIPPDWPYLPDVLPILTDLVTVAPTSGYLAILFLNVIDLAQRASFVRALIDVFAAWCEAYGVDRDFWGETDIGGRLCGWFDKTLTHDPASHALVMDDAERLLRCLDVLVQSGIASARLLEERITKL